MKKALISILVMALFIPLNVKALAITNTRVEGTNQATVGQEFSLGFYVNYDEVKKNSVGTYGVWIVAYELIFDDSVFMVTGAESNVWNTIIYKEDGKYYILSEIGDENPDRNKCVDDILYCSEYGIVVKFFVKDTDKTSSTIKMGEVDVEVFPVKGDMNPEYVEDDSISLSAVSNKSQTININKPANVTVELPKEVVQDSKPKVSEPKANNNDNKTADSSKSSNAYLKDLVVKGYLLDFYKRTNDYELEVEKGVNTLEIDAKLIDEKSKLEIRGADDLKANNYKVLIIVTAEDGSKNTYTITVKEESEKKETKLTSTRIVAKAKELFKKYKLYIFVGLGCLLLIITIMIIINRVSDKKLGNKFDQF